MDTHTTTLPKPRKLRGWATYEGDEFSFRPTEEGSPSQLNVKTCKGGKTYETTSEKRPQKVAHLSCPADAPDLWAEYTNQLRLLGIRPLKEQSLSDKQRLVNEGGMQVFLDPKAAQLTYQGTIDLSQTKNWQSDLMRQLQIIVRTLPAEEKFKKAMNNIKKTKKV